MAYQQPQTAPGRRKRPVGATILGGFFGLLLGIGGGIFLQLAGVLDPASTSSLLAPAAGLLLGILAGLVGGRRTRVAATPQPPLGAGWGGPPPAP
jgi:hypothetical protein